LIYSVLLEIPLKSDKSGSLYTGGTYTICRHPGFLWFSFFNVSASLFFWYTPITLVLAGYTLCNFALVTIEDRVLFPKMFPQYGEYKKTTPFLIPR
jgi:protein-S-isoprenylcysteine O-methyltransferase Ste14